MISRSIVTSALLVMAGTADPFLVVTPWAAVKENVHKHLSIPEYIFP